MAYSYAQFYCCYLLRSSKMKRSFYIGSTPLPLRRLRQHNGELVQGAWRTKRGDKRPWEMLCIVSGFPSRISALQFEHAWQHPHSTRYIRSDKRISKRKTSAKTMPLLLGNVRLLFDSDSIRRWPLKFHIFDSDVQTAWDANQYKLSDPPSHIPVLVDIRRAGSDGVCGRQTDSASQRVHIHEGDGFGGIQGLRITNDTYDPYFSLSSQYKDDLSCSCGVCAQHTKVDDSVESSELDILVCSNANCLQVYHTICLAKEFLAKDTEQHALPVVGKCLQCHDTLNWGLLIRNAFWRDSNQSLGLSANQQRAMIEENDDVSVLSDDSESSHGNETDASEDNTKHKRVGKSPKKVAGKPSPARKRAKRR
ncbi:uncharacterized protein V1518DRAFT_420243 [Limtongia smithiae]|uniref:uncharacterized protein n=1 Tax=Limtongia smithiae TaxID=1125753 RepID=UPI0034CF6A7C